MTKRTIGVALAAVVLALAGPQGALGQAGPGTPAAAPAAAPAAPVTPVPVEKPKTGEVRVKIVAPAKTSVKKATIYAKTQTVTNAGEEVAIPGVPVGRLALTVDAAIDEGPKKGVKRYLGVTEVTVDEATPQAATVELVAAPAMDPFCLGCHANARDPKVKVKPGQIARDVHISGKEFPEKDREKYLSQLKAHNDTIAKLEKEGKPHNFPMSLEERIVVLKGGKEVKKLYYTCETCHTLHQTTPWIRYARAPYRDKADLCVACHF